LLFFFKRNEPQNKSNKHQDTKNNENLTDKDIQLDKRLKGYDEKVNIIL